MGGYSAHGYERHDESPSDKSLRAARHLLSNHLFAGMSVTAEGVNDILRLYGHYPAVTAVFEGPLHVPEAVMHLICACDASPADAARIDVD